jgi:catechol 2,3-dioxygenase-like lactoylglutathione lyase family enzyme
MRYRSILLLVALATPGGGPSERPAREPTMSMKLYRVILPVSDIARAERFYSALTGSPGERVSPGRHYFDLGGTILAVYDPAADGDEPGDGWRPHPNQYIYLSVGDLEAAVDRAIRAGAEPLGEGIEAMPWGERLFYARDPFGNPICLVDERTVFTGGASQP